MDTVSYLLGDPEIAAVRGDLLPRSIAVKDNRLEEDPQGLFQLVFANGIEAWSVPDGGREYEIVGTEGTLRSMWDGAAVTFRKAEWITPMVGPCNGKERYSERKLRSAQLLLC